MVASPNYQTMREKKQAWQITMLGTSFRFVLVFVVSFVGILYVMQTSNLSAKGYELSDLNKQINTLEQENQRLDYEIANQQSMQSLEERVKKLNLVTMGNIEYATLLGNEVAVR
jgi:cell division protein FtsL